MKITRKQLIKLITEALSEAEAQYFGPVFAEVIADYEDPKNAGIFKDFQTFTAHNSKYPKMSMLGSGAFRVTFEDLDDPRFLLKVAKPGKKTALQDNITEIKVFNQFPEIFPKVFYAAPDGRFFITERVEVLGGNRFSNILEEKFSDVFKKIKSLPRFINSGADPYEQSSDPIKNMWRDLVVSMEMHRIDENFDELINSPNPDLRKSAVNLLKLQFHHTSAKVAFTTEEICEIIEGTSFKKIFNVINSLGIAFRELRADNMGVTPEGRLVIIDNSQLDKVGPLTAIKCVTPVRVDKDIASYMNPDAEVFDPVTKKAKKSATVSAPKAKLAPGQAKRGTADFYGDIFGQLDNINPDDIDTELFDTEFDLENFIKLMKAKNKKEREQAGDGLSGKTSKTGEVAGTLGTGVMQRIREHFEKFLKDVPE
jgi:hypothetical protein